jgi:hypothetical protein
MLESERWFNGHIRYQVGVPNGFYTVLLYFSENYPPGVSASLGGTGGATAARLFDLEVEGQRLNLRSMVLDLTDFMAAVARKYQPKG